MGEGGAIASPAALANAVRDALAPLGVRITTQPLTPDRIIGLIEDGRPVR
jgi:carbon-monoxide dehydrogenase large subunit